MQQGKKRKKKVTQSEKENIELSLFADEMTSHAENPKNKKITIF